jgi:transglutaminase-like putative cysteine protease
VIFSVSTGVAWNARIWAIEHPFIIRMDGRWMSVTCPQEGQAEIQPHGPSANITTCGPARNLGCRKRLKHQTIESSDQNLLMKIHAGYEIAFEVPQPTPVILMLSVHPSRTKDLLRKPTVLTFPSVPMRQFRDSFGNICTRVVAPTGGMEISGAFDIFDSGRPDEVSPTARQYPVDELPDESLVYLLGSRYCDTQKLSDFAWQQFAKSREGWERVKAICDFVHNHLKFGYQYARNDRTASDAFNERVGVCRDFAHLAVALCRCMNIPARYCTGYLGDIGVPPDPAPMDFSAWFEVFLEGRWFAFDARHNHPRIGRIVIARGRDAADVAISTSFGPTKLTRFKVVTEEVKDQGAEIPFRQANVA